MIKSLIILFFVIFCYDVLSGQESYGAAYPYRTIEVDCKMRKPDIFILKSKEEFEELCRNASLSDINFDNEILIGFFIMDGGCRKPRIDFEVIKYSQKKTIDCVLQIEYTGSCRMGILFSEWIAIKKPNDDFEVRTNVVKISNR